MALNYGVLRGKVDTFKREDNTNSPHLQIRVIDDRNAVWRVPVNVLSGDKSFLVFHRVDPLQNHPLIAGLPQIATGFTLLPKAARTTGSAVDYLRAPLFDWTTGIAIPPSGPLGDDDLQDTLTTYLTQLKAQAGELYVFGAKWPEPGQSDSPRPIDREFHTSQGIHDIHMNQGNPNPGQFAGDNGVFQDGGLILKFPARVVGLFFRFQSQWLPTNDTTGHPLPNARPIPPGSSPVVVIGQPETPVTTPVATFPTAYIERALVNPAGDDPGKERVVIGNTTSSSIDLTGWGIIDKNNKKEVIAALTIPAGESRLLTLSGNGAQLGNNGGTIRLVNVAGEQIHAVSYAKEDASEQGRYIRFNN